MSGTHRVAQVEFLVVLAVQADDYAEGAGLFSISISKSALDFTRLD